MNALVQTAIDAGVADLDRVLDAPVEPFGFGSDLSCDSDLTEEMVELDGDDVNLLVEACVRRLDCPRGGLPDDPDYGIDVRGMLNEGVPNYELATLGTRIRAELSKDDRIASVTASAVMAPDGRELTIAISVVPFAASVGGFALTLSVTSAEVIVTALRSAA